MGEQTICGSRFHTLYTQPVNPIIDTDTLQPYRRARTDHYSMPKPSLSYERLFPYRQHHKGALPIYSPVKF